MTLSANVYFVVRSGSSRRLLRVRQVLSGSLLRCCAPSQLRSRSELGTTVDSLFPIMSMPAD